MSFETFEFLNKENEKKNKLSKRLCFHSRALTERYIEPETAIS